MGLYQSSSLLNLAPYQQLLETFRSFFICKPLYIHKFFCAIRRQTGTDSNMHTDSRLCSACSSSSQLVSPCMCLHGMQTQRKGIWCHILPSGVRFCTSDKREYGTDIGSQTKTDIWLQSEWIWVNVTQVTAGGFKSLLFHWPVSQTISSALLFLYLDVTSPSIVIWNKPLILQRI